MQIRLCSVLARSDVGRYNFKGKDATKKCLEFVTTVFSIVGHHSSNISGAHKGEIVSTGYEHATQQLQK